MRVSRRPLEIIHVLFANDCIIFDEDTTQGVNGLKTIMETYKCFSRQKVNLEKSALFSSSNTSRRESDLISQDLGVRCLEKPKKYLALPNVVRRQKRSFQSLKDKMVERVNNSCV